MTKKKQPLATGTMKLNRDGTMTISLSSRRSGVDLRKLAPSYINTGKNK